MPEANLPQGGGARQVCNRCSRFEARRVASFSEESGNSSLYRFFCDVCVSELDIWENTLALNPLSPSACRSDVIETDGEFWRLLGPLLSSNEKSVYMALVHLCANRRGSTTNREIIEQSGCRERSMHRAKSKLATAGLIVCTNRSEEGAQIFIVRPRATSQAEGIVIRPTVYPEAAEILEGKAQLPSRPVEADRPPLRLVGPPPSPSSMEAQGGVMGDSPLPVEMTGGGVMGDSPPRADTLSLNFIYACREASIGSTSEGGVTGVRGTPSSPLVAEVLASVSDAWPSYRSPRVWETQIGKLAEWLQAEGIKPKPRILIRFLLHQAHNEQLCARDARGQLHSKLHVATTREELLAWLANDRKRARERAEKNRAVQRRAEAAAEQKQRDAESEAAREASMTRLKALGIM